MKIKLSRRGSKKVTEPIGIPAQISRMSNASNILSYLERERVFSAAAIAHVEPALADVSRWFLARHEDDFALCMIAKSISPTMVFTLGKDTLLEVLLASIPLPTEVLINCHPKHLDAIEKSYEMEWHNVMRRMVATRESFTPSEGEVERLRPAHIRELNHLFEAQSGHTFDPRQVRRGVYYGVWRDDRLVSVAGTHFIAPTYGIAYVGNVLTHPEYRNQGLGSICTSAVTEDLLDYCTEVVLNTEPHNLPAIQSYANLGYKDDCLLIEAMGRRRSYARAVVTDLWKKFGPLPNYEERMEPNG